MTKVIDLNHMICEESDDFYSYLNSLGITKQLSLTDQYESQSDFMFHISDTDFNLRIEE